MCNGECPPTGSATLLWLNLLNQQSSILYQCKGLSVSQRLSAFNAMDPRRLGVFITVVLALCSLSGAGKHIYYYAFNAIFMNNTSLAKRPVQSIVFVWTKFPLKPACNE